MIETPVNTVILNMGKMKNYTVNTMISNMAWMMEATVTTLSSCTMWMIETHVTTVFSNIYGLFIKFVLPMCFFTVRFSNKTEFANSVLPT